MVETKTRPIPQCSQCGRRQTYFTRSKAPDESRSSRVDLDDAGLCVDCATVSHSCSLGAACEYERIADWRGGYAGSASLIPMLRLCDAHDAIRKQRLANA